MQQKVLKARLFSMMEEEIAVASETIRRHAMAKRTAKTEMIESMLDMVTTTGLYYRTTEHIQQH